MRYQDLSNANFTNLFRICGKLSSLDVYQSKISKWPDFALAYKLKSLQMGNNQIRNLTVIENGFPENNILESLDIGLNKFGNSFTPNFLVGLNKLKALNLRKNDITVFPNVSSFIGNLAFFDIGENRGIQTIDPKALLGVDNFTSGELPQEGYPKMLQLRFYRLNIPYFPSELFQVFPHLHTITLYDNRDHLRNVPNFNLIQDSLITVDIGWNDGTVDYELSPYPTFPYETVFYNMSKLRNVYMAGLWMSKFPFSEEHIKSHMPALRNINIQYNVIQTVPNIASLRTEGHNPHLKARACSY